MNTYEIEVINNQGKTTVIQIEANYDRARETARGYGALASAIEEALFDFYREHTGQPIY